jgi:hypothetical protein
MIFLIPLVADARASARVKIDADTLEAAQTQAIERARDGNVSFEYDGIETDTIELGDE